LRLILLVSSPKNAQLEEFFRSQGATLSVGCGSSTFGAYGVRAIPSKFLIGVDGKVLATGRVTKEQIDAALAQVSRPPARDYSELFEGALREIERGRFGEAQKELKSLERNRHATDADKENLAALQAWIEEQATKGLADAEGLAESDPVAARDRLEKVQARFEGTPTEKEAKKLLKSLESKNKKLFKAADLMRRAAALEAAGQTREAIAAYTAAASAGKGLPIALEAEAKARALQSK
jgi:hypothetical protein